MSVIRIVPNIAASDLETGRRFYTEVLGLGIVMDLGWIVTFAAAGDASPQLSVALEGGSGAPVPDLSIEVDNFDEVHARVLAAGLTVEYGPLVEPWGVRRFFVRDPFGRLLNILVHQDRTR